VSLLTAAGDPPRAAPAETGAVSLEVGDAAPAKIACERCGTDTYIAAQIAPVGAVKRICGCRTCDHFTWVDSRGLPNERQQAEPMDQSR
jgi:hypothetical protein